ncbi:MAG: radical SAM protein [Methylococcales bacterium]|jgi:radical SAM superfamily enzyme YgiQ (UPF0313 family)|nr:radical SAM protein [Methylococcales bacterium]
MSLNHIQPVYRPPSEANSLILQITNGCSWNHCRFCDMYTEPQKKFNFKTFEQIENELMGIKQSGQLFRRIFLADGDAMTLSFRRLHKTLLLIKKYLPNIQRVSSYCLPRNIKNKSVQQLTELNNLGLKLLYIGCESGDNQILKYIDKGETLESSLNSLLKIKQSGIKSSIMILNGLGGINFSAQHAENSAILMNQVQPDYLSTLVVTFPFGMERFAAGFNGQFIPADQITLFTEMKILLNNMELDKTIFRSDHASNYLILKGVLNQDKKVLLSKINKAIKQPELVELREEWQRGL